MLAPQIATNRCIWLKFVIGINPGRIGRVDAGVADSALEREKLRVVKEELRDQKIGAGFRL